MPMFDHKQLLDMYHNGRYEEILTAMEQDEVRIQQDPLGSQVIASAYFQLGKFEQAAQILQNHISSLGQDVSFLSLYGAVLRRLGRLTHARELLGRALNLEPKSTPVRNNYANLLIDIGEYPDARRILETLLLENPNYDDAKLNLNRLTFREEQAKQSIEAIPDTAKSISWQPADPLMLAFSDEEVSKAGAINFSKSHSNTASAISSKIPTVDVLAVAADKIKLATKSIQEDNPSFALQLITDASSHLGAHVAIYMNAADAYIRLKRFSDAEVCFLHALQLGGPSFPALLNLSSLASIRKDFSLARYYLEAAASIDPHNSNLVSIRKQIDEGGTSSHSAFNFQDRWSQFSLERV